MRSKKLWFAVAGGVSGLINGFFGGGGGMILVPLLAGSSCLLLSSHPPTQNLSLCPQVLKLTGMSLKSKVSTPACTPSSPSASCGPYPDHSVHTHPLGNRLPIQEKMHAFPSTFFSELRRPSSRSSAAQDAWETWG